MSKVQFIPEQDDPKFVVLPFGDKEAIQDYLDELWARRALKEFNDTPNHKLHSIDELDAWLASDDEKLMQG